MASVIDTVVNLAKRRGLVYPAGEIYGGTKSAWDYGPLGVELKENIKRQWWRTVVTGRDARDMLHPVGGRRLCNKLSGNLYDAGKVQYHCLQGRILLGQ